jgi:hypothetical protein
MVQNIKQNYLSPVEFRFVIQRLPYTTFFTQNVSLPGVSINPVEQGTPFKTLYFTGDRLLYDQFSVTFRVNENMDNYLEIYNWMVGLSFPDRFAQFANLEASDQGLYSDATLMIMNSGRTANIQYKLRDIFPINLSNIDLDTTVGDIDYVTATATFQLGSYDIETV